MSPQVFLIIRHVPLVRLLAWILLAGDTEVFTERGATLYTSSPRYIMCADHVVTTCYSVQEAGPGQAELHGAARAPGQESGQDPGGGQRLRQRARGKQPIRGRNCHILRQM